MVLEDLLKHLVAMTHTKFTLSGTGREFAGAKTDVINLIIIDIYRIQYQVAITTGKSSSNDKLSLLYLSNY